MENLGKGSGRIVVGHNPLLRKVVGFECLRQVSGGVYILENHCLTQICGFINLLNTNAVVINENKNLHKIIGFCYIETILTELLISCNNGDGDDEFVIDAFHNLTSADSVIIYCNRNLRTFNLNSLCDVCDNFVVELNKDLELFKVNKLHHVGALIVRSNRYLLDFEFKSLEQSTLGIYIEYNDSLKRIANFNSLKRVDQSIHIIGNRQLLEIAGFESLRYIGSQIYNIANCEPLLDCNKCQGALTNWACSGDLPNFCATCYDITIEHDSNSHSDTDTDSDSDSQSHHGRRHRRNSDCGCGSEKNVSCVDNTGAQVLNYLPTLCPIALPVGIDKYLCAPDTKCTKKDDRRDDHDDDATTLLTSLVIYNNDRLMVVTAFNELFTVESNIYIIRNKSLKDIVAFNKLEFVLDLWIRNNPSIKRMEAFDCLRNARAISILETVCMTEFVGFNNLKHAEYILVEALYSKSVKGLKGFKPTVNGTFIYYK